MSIEDLIKKLKALEKGFNYRSWYTNKPIKDLLEACPVNVTEELVLEELVLEELLKEEHLGECGTTACLAGWVVYWNKEKAEQLRKEGVRSTMEAAQRILGIDDRTAFHLFLEGSENGTLRDAIYKLEKLNETRNNC